jgi:hypothetical protein
MHEIGVTKVSFNQSSLSVTLKVPSGQIGSAWEWYNWIGLKKDINHAICFWFFNFDLEYLRRVQISEPLQTKMNSIVGITVCLESFLPVGCHTFICWKNPQSAALFWFGLRIVGFLHIFYSQAVIPRKIVDCIFGARFGRKNRGMCPYKMIQPVIPTRRMITGISVWSGSELWSLFKYSKLKLKNWKPTEVDALFYAYLMVPLTWRSNLARQYL